MSSRNNFDQTSSTDDVLEGIDVAGKHFLVTGGSSGLGAETARSLAAKGASVTITARDLDKARAVTDSIQSATGKRVDIEALELGSFTSIRDFSKRINASGQKIDCVINNAGVMACPQGTTEEGLELQFGSNHIGHFLMTNLIAPSIKNGGRIISLSSAGHKIAPVDFEDPNFNSRDYEKWLSYGQAKTANALFAVELNERLQSRDIEAFAVHPGMIMTDLSRHLTEDDFKALSEGIAANMSFKTPEQGAATQVFAATAPELKGKGGGYLANCQLCETANEGDEADTETAVRPYAVSKEKARQLWDLSEKIVGETFSY